MMYGTLKFPRTRSKGFALIATISVMVLLVMIALAMLSLASIELRQKTNTTHQEEARANARMALMMAVADLQQHAGADRRVTAPASILSDSVDPRKRNWTTVWDTSVWDVEDPVNSRDSQAFLRTLVSQKTIPTTTTRASATVELESSVPASDDSWVQLVGDGSVNDTDDQVYAEKVDVVMGNAQGSYAYWVGEEGTKARFDITADEDAAIETWAQAGRMGVPSGTGIHQMTGMEAYTDYLPGAASVADLPKFLSYGSLDLSSVDKTEVSNYFHHITNSHIGLLVDNRWGGIRRDLSTAFELGLEDFGDISEFNASEEVNLTDAYSSYAPSDLTSNPLYYSDDTDTSLGYLYEIPVDSSNRYRGPTWDVLRNHYRTYKKERNDLNFRGVSVSTGSDALVAHSVLPLTYNRSPGVGKWNNSLGAFHMHPHSNAKAHNFFPIVSEHGVAGSHAARQDGARNEPTVQKVAPQLIRMVIQYGLAKDNDDFYLTVNPFFTIHNPYNYPIEFYSLSFDFSYVHYLMSLDVTYKNTSNGNTNKDFSMAQRVGAANAAQSFRLLPSGNGNNRLEPGEVRIISVEGFQQVEDGPNYIIPIKLAYDVAAGAAIGGSLKHTMNDIDMNDPELTITGQFRRASGSDLSYPIPRVYTRLHHPVDALGGAFDLFNTNTLTTNVNSLLDREFTELIQNVSILPQSSSRTTITRNVNQIGDLASGGTGLFTIDLGLKDFSGGAAVLSDFNYRSLATDPADYDKSHAVSPNWDLTLSTTLVDALQIAGSDGTSAFWGEGKSASGSGSSKIVLFDLPRTPMVSLGGLQHADTSKFNNHAARSIGHSRPQVGQSNLTTLYNQFQPSRFTNMPCHYQFDTSWAANEALWDRYYFSGINWGDADGQLYSYHDEAVSALINGDSERALMNSRLTMLTNPTESDRDDLKDYSKIGNYFGIAGAFNVNSTSVEAWKAVLSSLSGREISYLTGNNLNNLQIDSDQIPISRFSTPASDDSDDYAGFRSLNNSELQALAEAIVEEVKERGPFMGLADFVNRRLVSDETGEAGALQAAIDESGINDNLDIGSTTGNGLQHSAPSASQGMARHLDQGDLVNLLGPIMSTRSDTFVVRAYGESRDQSGVVRARAWCEAVVQRTPEWVVDTDVESTVQNPSYPEDNSMDDPILRQWIPNDAMPATAEQMGRRFKINSFRWLTADEV